METFGGMTRTRWLLLGVTAAGAVLRFATLGGQSLWVDELVTGSLLHRDFVAMIHAIPSSERTPYLYYVLAWIWTRLAGDGEFGLRSLSALAGTATVPVAYLVGASLVTRRAGLVAAALVAVNPFLVWYSQEARAYALVAFFTTLSLLFFARALERRPRALVWWAIACAAALATHYFAVFLVAPEAVWLLVVGRRRRDTLLALALPAAVLLGHAPLVVTQAGNAEGIDASALATRVVGLVKDVTVGYSFPAEVPGTVVAAGLVAVGLALLVTRTPRRDRRGALIALALVGVSILLPVALTFVGLDYVIARNAIVAVVPAAVALAAGYASTRIGLAAAAALCGLSVAIVVSVASNPLYGRTDWRGAAKTLSEADGARAVVITPPMTPDLWRPYIRGLAELDRPVAVREITVLGLATEGGFSGGAVVPPEARPKPPPPGFHLVQVVRRPTLTLVRYAARAPTRVSPVQLADLRLTDAPGRVLLQRAP